MTEVWLRSNRRALALGMIVPAALGAAGIGINAWALTAETGWGVKLFGLALLAVACGLLLSLWLQLKRPRVAFDAGRLLLFLRHGDPIRVPIEYVEGFLLGQGPSMLSGDRPASWETTTLVIRIAEKATEFGHVEVNASLGSWCNHYVTIRGAWCEPLSVELVQRLNARLAHVSPSASSQAAS